MATWRVVFSQTAHKQYKKLPTGYHKNFDTIFERLAEREPIDIKPVTSEEGVYRIRVGEYRILFKEIAEDKTYLIFRISTRGGAYKK